MFILTYPNFLTVDIARVQYRRIEWLDVIRFFFPISEFCNEVGSKKPYIPLEGSSDTFVKLQAENLSIARM